jgi:hypothetical protein
MAKKECQSASKSRSTPHDKAPESLEESPLSPRRAFVVQFWAGAGTARERFAGRVEHIVSGHATHFHSPEDLWAFFTRILVNVQE